MHIVFLNRAQVRSGQGVRSGQVRSSEVRSDKMGVEDYCIYCVGLGVGGWVGYTCPD